MPENQDASRELEDPRVAGSEAVSPPLGEVESRESAMGDVLGAPTWPVRAPELVSKQPPPPVGMNWQTVAQQLDIDRDILEHDGVIVLAGEYFPEPGYFLEPATLRARFVDVGHIALRHGYFLGQMVLRDVHAELPTEEEAEEVRHPIIPSSKSGPIIGLFADEAQAERAKQRILQSALGSGVGTETGPLGVELRVEHPEIGGRVATVIAGHSGAIISLGGVAIAPLESEEGATATGRAMTAEGADAHREGTGAASDTQGPAAEPGSSQEFRPV